jgi:preprotein translocase subunit SecD
MSKALPIVRTASLAVMAGVTFLAGCSLGSTPAPAERTVAVVDVQPVEGAAAPDLPDVASRLRQLLSAMGFTGAQADVTGSTRVTVSVDGGQMTKLQAALAPGPLMFRKVLNIGPGASNGAVPTASSGASPGAVTLDSVKAAVGPQAWAAATVMAGTQRDAGQSFGDTLAPFGKLTAAQVAVLPPAMQFYVGQIGCAALNGRAPGATDNPQATVVVCDGGSTKYLLDVAKVTGSDVGSTSSSQDASSSSGAWAVHVTFSSTGAGKWSALTTEAFNNAGGQCVLTQPALDPGHAPVCEIALVQGNRALIAPAIQGVLSSDAILAGTFSQQQAQTLAAQLSLAGLPVKITVFSVSE